MPSGIAHTGDMAAVANWLFMFRNGARRCPAVHVLITNFSKSSAGTPPQCLVEAFRGWPTIAPDPLRHNWRVHILHNFDEIVENESRIDCVIRRVKVHASSAQILKEHRQACVPGDGASSFWRMWKQV